MLINNNQKQLGMTIIQDIPTDPDIALLSGEISWVVISFLSNKQDQEFLARCKTRNVSVHDVIKVHDAVENYSPKARTRYSEFISNWPIDTLINGVSFKQKFSYKHEISYWWLTDASVKQNESSLTFDYLCHLELINSTMNMSYSKCVYIGHDNLLSLLVFRLCEKHNIHFISLNLPRVKTHLSVIHGILSRFWFAFKILWIWIFFKVFNFSKPELSSNVIGFYTIYPSTSFLEDSSLNDRNYRQLPEIINNQSDRKALFCVSFHPKNLSHWMTALKSITTRQNANKPNHVFIESFLTFNDVIVVLMNLVFVSKYIMLHKYNATFRRSFEYLEIDIYELIGLEQARSLLGNQLPDSIILARLTERSLNKYPMTHLICFLELYPSARAIYYGASKSKTSIKTVAYQHASINSMKLWYSYSEKEIVRSHSKPDKFISSMPIPDMYLFQGNLGRSIITESGYPEDRCLVTGSPRYDRLARIRKTIDSHQQITSQQPDNTQKSKAKQVLVVPSLSTSDALELIETTLLAWQQGRSEYDNGIPIQITIKPHPATILSNKLNVLIDKYKCECMSESSEDLYTLILKADVVITSYSTAGEEAIALQTPVICYAGTSVTMSSFLDIHAAPIVHDPEELDNVLKKVISPEDHPLHDPHFITPYQDNWQFLIDQSFYRLDALASDRIISELFRMQ